MKDLKESTSITFTIAWFWDITADKGQNYMNL